jgi:hypothetical protein
MPAPSATWKPASRQWAANPENTSRRRSATGDGRALFEHEDVETGVCQHPRRGRPGGAGADDDHIREVAVAADLGGQGGGAPNTGHGFAQNGGVASTGRPKARWVSGWPKAANAPRAWSITGISRTR